MTIDYLQLADRTWPLLRRLMRVHTIAYRATGGVIGHRLPGWRQMLLLDHVGAKSQIKRTTPLLYAIDGQNVVIVASKGGYPQNPAWYHNLLAHPDTTVQIRAERRPVHARVTTAEERERLWPLAVAVYRSYESYQQRTGREIPLVVLEPR
jgi:deazaflavin-dependent oxidoreductase (nitroreductase family)